MYDPPDQAKPTTKQPASMRTCSPALSPIMGRRLAVVTKCSDSDTGPPPQSVASCTLAHKIAASSAIGCRQDSSCPTATPPTQPNKPPHPCHQLAGCQMLECSGSNEVDCLNNQPAGSQARLPCHP